MYQLCADGYGSRTIANILANEGIRKRTGKNFTEDDVLRIIRNPLNMGTAVMNRLHFDFESKKIEKVPKDQQFHHEHKVPPTVSKELWDAANNEIDRRAVKANQKGSFPRGSNPGKYNLSGKIFCGLCGKPYYRRFRKGIVEGKPIVEWKCSKYCLQGRKAEAKVRPQISKIGMKGEKGCDNVHLDEKKLYGLLEKICVEKFSVDRDTVIRDTIALLRKVLEENLDSGRMQIFIAEEEKLKKQQDLLLDKLLNGTISDEIYKRRQETLEKSLEKCRNNKKKLEKQNIRMLSRKRRIDEIERHLREGEDIERATVNEMLEEIERMIIYPNYMEIIYNPLKTMGLDQASDEKGLEQKIRIDYGNLFDQLRQKQEDREQVVELIRKDPGITAKKIAECLGCSLSGAQYKLKVLKNDGRIRFNGKGGRGYWEILS